VFEEEPFKKAFHEAEVLSMSPGEYISYYRDLDSKFIGESIQEQREDKVRAEVEAAAAVKLAEVEAAAAAATTKLAEVEAAAAAAAAKLAETEAAVAAERAAAAAKLAETEAAAAAKLAESEATAAAKLAAAKLDTARQMKRDGLPADVIAKYTGLNTADIAKL
jgi:hypothetical protein